MNMTMSAIQFQKLGTVEYLEAVEVQQRLVSERLSGKINDTVLLLEHPPVITQGKRECSEDFLTSEEEVRASGIDIVHVDRGGRLTYHGPGQLVAYFICDVTAYGGVKEFVRLVEDALIGACSDVGIEARRNIKHPGVWVGDNKIAAIGLHVSKGVSSHGIALNVSCDLDPYKHIVACGIHDAGVTSMKECGVQASIDEVSDLLMRNVEKLFVPGSNVLTFERSFEST
jgi:lipoyl(octanoyl) transferase